MQALFILAIVAATSVAAAAIARRGFEWSGRALAAGLMRTLEYVGAGLVFFVVNLLAAVLALLAARALTRAHVSLYPVNDVALLALSLLQGLTFQCWRNSSSDHAGRS
jgi:hypothetical protein